MLCYCVASKIRTSTLPLCSSPGIDSFEGKYCGFTEESERERECAPSIHRFLIERT